VTIGGIDLTGLTATEARSAIVQAESRLGNEPITVTVAESQFTLLPYAVGYDLDEQAVVDEALQIGRQGAFPRQMGWWLGHSPEGRPTCCSCRRPTTATPHRNPPPWEAQAIGDPPTEGGIKLRADVPIYPAPTG
jgi:hypothetical protein